MKAIILVLTKRGLTVPILLLFLSSMLNAQGVLIKERVEINPQLGKKQAIHSMSTIRLEVSFSGSVRTDPGNNYHSKYFYSACERTSVSGNWYGEPVTFETPAGAGGGGHGTFSMWPTSEGLFSIKWYYGGVLVKDQSSWVSCIPCIVSNFPYYSIGNGFTLITPSDIYHGGAADLGINRPISFEPCSFPAWDYSVGITFTITEGTEYGEFQTTSGESLGISFTRNWGQLNTIYYIANGALPDTSGSTVCIRATSGDVDTEARFKVMARNYFEVRIVPDTLATADTVAYTEGAKLFVQAKDQYENNLDFNASTPLIISLRTNREYGTFIDAYGDTLKGSNVELFYVYYSDAKAGKVKFIATKKNPDSVVTCKIKVQDQNNGIMYGERDAVVVEQTLKILMDQPYQVRPSIPTEGIVTARVNQRKKSFEVKMTRGGKPVANHSFRLWTDYVKSSGGHIHGVSTDSARRNTNDNFGYFIVGQSKRRPLDTLTNTSGRFSTIYSSSLFGDTMRIYLKSKNKPLLLDSINVVEKVDSLIDFKRYHPPTEQMYTFAQLDTTSMLRHPDNNWCLSRFADSLQFAIFDFYNWSLTVKGGGVAIILSLNDMSLPLGGRYDIDALWDRSNVPNKPHKRHVYHRTGTSVDVNKSKTFGLTTDKIKDLTNFIKLHDLGRNKERPEIHYGFNEED